MFWILAHFQGVPSKSPTDTPNWARFALISAVLLEPSTGDPGLTAKLLGDFSVAPLHLQGCHCQEQLKQSLWNALGLQRSP